MSIEAAYFGPIVAKFYCSGRALEIFKAQGYKKNKPSDMDNDDVYLVAPFNEKVEVEFFGVQNQPASHVEVNDNVFSGLPSTRIELEEGVNEIIVVVNNKEHYLAVYLVRESEVAHENSGGIIWNEEVGYYEFESLGFFEYIGSFFFDVYEETGMPIIAVEGEVHQPCCGGNCQTNTTCQPTSENVSETILPVFDESVKTGSDTTFTAQVDTTPTPTSSFDVEPVKSPDTYSCDTGSTDTTSSSSSSYDSGGSSSSSSSSSSYDSGSSSSSSYDSGSSSSSSYDSGSSW